MATGCAQYMAIKQPSPFKPACLDPGVKRINVIAELGQPVNAESNTNNLTEAYKYVDGEGKNSGTSKTVRVVLYTAGDIFTLFLVSCNTLIFVLHSCGSRAFLEHG